MQTYNQISDDCFSNCVYSFNARDLTNEEVNYYKDFLKILLAYIEHS